MGILNALERLFIPSRQSQDDEERVMLQEIFCKRNDEEYVKRFRTPAVGVEFKNTDGSDRQEALQKLKIGEKVRLIWDAGKVGKKHKVYLLRGGKGRRLSMSDCFGILNDRTAADVIRWLTKENIVATARIDKITGGTKKHRKYGCMLELTTYPGPVSKK